MNTLRQNFEAPEAGTAFLGSNAGVPTQAVGVIPQFYMGTEIDGNASRRQGRIIHKNVEMVLLLFAGSNNQSIRRKVLPEDQKAYAQQYRAFKTQNAQVPDGTALTEWPSIDRATAETLKLMNILTVEQLANLSDGQLMDLGMGGGKLRQKAIDWLQISQGTADAMQMAEKLRDMQSQIDALTRDNEALQTTVENQSRVAEIAANVSGGRNPLTSGLQAPLSEPASDPSLDRMLLEANGLDPSNAAAAADVQENQGLDTFDDGELEPLELNKAILEAE